MENEIYGKKSICEDVNITFPPQHQNRMPGWEYVMNPIPESTPRKENGKLIGKVALITGGDSGIGRAIAYLFAQEGADIAFVYFNEREDAATTKQGVEAYHVKCLALEADLRKEEQAKQVVDQVIGEFGKINILINNCGVQFIQTSIEDITKEQLYDTFVTNIFSYFYMTKAVLPYMKEGDSIINTTSITAYHGEPLLLDYSATKGAVTSFTRSLSQSLIERGIRVNGVAPGPIWTPLIPASYSAEQVETFGSYTSQVPMKRAGQPNEIAPAYLFLASDEASYMTGQVLHPNGGTIVNG